MKKTLSLIVVDGETRGDEWPFGDGSVFPSGPMREPLGAGLARADAVIVLLPADAPAADSGLIALFAGKPVLIARLEPLAAPPPGRQLGFAGVGKPWKVERALRAAGCDLVDFAPLPDHAPISLATLRFLADRAEALGAGLITTEKDWMRLPPAGARASRPGRCARGSRTRRPWIAAARPCDRPEAPPRLQLRELPGRLAQPRHPGFHGRGLRAVGGAVADAADDALQDPGQAEDVVGEIPVQVRQARAAGEPAVFGHRTSSMVGMPWASRLGMAAIAPFTHCIRR